MPAVKHPRIPIIGIYDSFPVFSGHLHVKRNRLRSKFNFFKRISPFLIMVPFLVFLFPYMLFTGEGNIQSRWMLIVLFPITILNMIFFDFAIWNWFAGKKRGIIWTLELLLSACLLYLLV